MVSPDSEANKFVYIGPNESAVRVTSAENGLVSTDNSFQSPTLAGAGVLTGEWVDTLNYNNIIIGITTDQASATDGLEVQWSHDGTHVDDSDVFTILANSSKVFTFTPARRYLRIVYTNGGSTSNVDLQTIMKKGGIKASSHRIQDSIVAEDDAELVKAVITGQIPGDGFVNVAVTQDGNLAISDNSSGLAIAKGDVTGVTYVHKFGNAPDFDTTDGVVTIWDGANDGKINQMNYVYSTTAAIDSISSSNGSDTTDIEIQGLDSDYNLVIQTITLQGQTRVPLTTNLIRAFRMKNIGSTNLVGDVYLYENTTLSGGIPTDSTKVRAVTEDGNNQTLMAIYTVPAGKTAYMRSFFLSTSGANKSSNYVCDIYARPFGEVFQLKHKTSIGDSGTSMLQYTYTEPQQFTEKTDIEMRVAMQVVGGIGGSVSGGFDLVLVDN